MEADYLIDNENEDGLRNICADFAPHRLSLRKTLNSKTAETKEKRAAIKDKLERLVTQGPDSGYTRDNLSYNLPMLPVNRRRHKFDLKEGDHTEHTMEELRSSKKKPKHIKKVRAYFTFSTEYYQRESKPVLVTWYNVPRHLKLLPVDTFKRMFPKHAHNVTKTRGKMTLIEVLHALGGPAYRAWEWLTKNKSEDLLKAVKEAYRAMAKEYKKATGASLEDTVKHFAKAYDKVTEREVFLYISDLWDEKGAPPNKGEIVNKLNAVSRPRKACIVWYSHIPGDTVSYPSVNVAAQELGIGVGTVRRLMREGTPSEEGYYITKSSKIPEALIPKRELFDATKEVLSAFMPIMRDAQGEERNQLIAHYLLSGDLRLTAEKYNLREDVLRSNVKVAAQAYAIEVSKLKDNEKQTQQMESVSTDFIVGSDSFKNAGGDNALVQIVKSLTENGASTGTISTTGRSNINLSGQESHDKIDNRPE